ncbi:hypothetical protein [Marinobacter sp. NFXS9]|uniref:hypothetical protein n=1 Tax=Marinobacter sp. NFXS9 TaxID=2818433 RepID=UPI0032DE9B06
MNRFLTFLRRYWENLLLLAGLLCLAFVGGISVALVEIDHTVADFIEAHGCPVEGEEG